MVDDLTIIKSTNTDAINHEPAIMLMNTGNMNAGKPCLGSWLAYGLGSMNDNLPTFMVLQTKLNTKENNQPVSSRLWSSGFLSSEYAGVGLRSAGDPVLYLTDPNGVDREVRRKMLDAVNEINRQTYEELGDPETNARIAQYEMAYRMQTSVPELADLSKEPQSTWDLYGPEAKEPGTFAYNCLMARRMAERGVRFTQVYKRGWDVHDNVTGILPMHLPGDRPRLLRAGHRPEAARTAGRHAGDLGGRIRAHRLQPGRPDAQKTTAAIIIRAASPRGWRAAACAPASPTARPMTTATTWSRIRSRCAISTRPFCTAWASTTTS